MARTYDQALRPHNLKGTQFSLLAAIKAANPTSITKLAEVLAMDRTTLTRNLQIMRRHGLIRVGPEGYRRARALSLTDSGEAKLIEAYPAWRVAQDRLVAALGTDTWNDVRVALEHLANAT